MYCSSCGASIPDDSVFCPECGQSARAPAAGQAPGATPPPPAPPAGPGPGGVVPNYLVQTILVTIFCCLPAGIVGIINASQASSKQAAGDHAGAMRAAEKAKQWCWIAVGAGVVVLIVYAVFFLAASTSDDTSF